MPKNSRAFNDRQRRKPHYQKVKKNYKIVRSEAPKTEKKIVVKRELVKDPESGKATYRDIYDVKDVPQEGKKNVLYIPKKPKPKEFRYLRTEPPQFKEAKFSYPNPSDKFGSLEAYKKSELLNIAKKHYGLRDTMAEKLDKDDIIKFMKYKYKGKSTTESDFMKHTFKLGRVEPIRQKEISYKTGGDGKFEFTYGKRSYKADDPMVPKFEQINQKISANPKHKNIPLLGTTRPFNEQLYQAFKEGKAEPVDIASELMTHLNLDTDERLRIPFLDEKSLKKLYKKAYKQSVKPDEKKFTEGFYLPNVHYQKAPGFAKPPYMVDEIGKKRFVGTNKFPTALSPYETFDYSGLRGQDPEYSLPNPPPPPPPPKLSKQPIIPPGPQPPGPPPKFQGIKNYQNAPYSKQQLLDKETKYEGILPQIEALIQKTQLRIEQDEQYFEAQTMNYDNAVTLLQGPLSNRQKKKFEKIVNDYPNIKKQFKKSTKPVYNQLGDLMNDKLKYEARLFKVKEALQKK